MVNGAQMTAKTLNKKCLGWITPVLAILGMGMGMPSCPGQQAVQQQLETVQTSHTELAKKVQTLSTQLTTLSSDMAQVKQLLPQMTNIIQAQKTTIEQLANTVRELQQAKLQKPSQSSSTHRRR